VGRKASGLAIMGSGVAQPVDKLNKKAHSLLGGWAFSLEDVQIKQNPF